MSSTNTTAEQTAALQRANVARTPTDERAAYDETLVTMAQTLARYWHGQPTLIPAALIATALESVNGILGRDGLAVQRASAEIHRRQTPQ